MQQSTVFLTEDQKIIWTEAGTNFPGEQLDKVMRRVLTDLTVQPAGEHQTNFYEIRRFDAPLAFNTILKLQNARAAWRYIEVDKEELREVLRIEATLFELIMKAIALLLDVFLRVLGGVLKISSSSPTEPPEEPPKVAPPIPQKYVPTWKRQLGIERDDGGYTS